MEQDSEKRLVKGYLKNLPIWGELDYVKASVKKLSKDLDQYNLRQNKRLKQIEQLVHPSTDQNLRIKAADEIDNGFSENRIYKLIDGDYIYQDPNDLDLGCNAGRKECLQLLSAQVFKDEEVFAQINSGKPWVRCRIVVVYNKSSQGEAKSPITTFRLRTGPEFGSRIVQVNKYSVARILDLRNKLEPPKRVIAGLNDNEMMPGTIAYEPFEWNINRYLLIMDDGSAKYFKSSQIYPIIGQSLYPWVDPRFLLNRNRMNEFYLRDYLTHYPNRNLLHALVGENLQVYRGGVLKHATIIGIDCDIIKVRYEDSSIETIYRGSVRFRIKDHQNLCESHIDTSIGDYVVNKLYFQLVVNCKAYHDVGCRATNEDIFRISENFEKVIVSKGGEPEKRSESPKRIKVILDDSRPDLDRDSDVSSTSSRFHLCSPECLKLGKRGAESSMTDLIGEFRDVCDLKVPLFLGWQRELVTTQGKNGNIRTNIVYEAPCGKTFKRIYYLRRYLEKTRSKLDIDYFSFDIDVDLKKKIPEMRAYYFVKNIAVDYDTKVPLENKYISALNRFTEEELAYDFKYRDKCFPHPKLVQEGFTLDTEFKSGCDCEDDCQQRSSCACHRLNEETYGIDERNRNSLGDFCRYHFKRLPEFVRTGIFECNSLCKCSSKCGNRVVQNGMRFRLQVVKTFNKGWGVISLDDIPKGAFICTYAAEILDDANQYGDDDMYFADMDYVSVNEIRKLGYSDDENDTGVDTEASIDDDVVIVEHTIKAKMPRESTSDSDNSNNQQKLQQIDSKPSRKRVPKAKKSSTSRQRQPESNVSPKKKDREDYRSIHDILNSHDFTLDARLAGNIGRFLNHSCEPNTFVQNIFIESHDLRFPVVALFSKRAIKAQEEIAWDYGYQMGSVPGRTLFCNCGAKTCKGRIL